jgi:hypothetical protein
MPPSSLDSSTVGHHSATLDSRHNEFLRKFKEEEDVTIPKLLEQILHAKERLALKLPLEERLVLKDTVRSNKRKIREMEVAKHNYFLTNGRHIFGYFDEKKRISEGGSDNVTVLTTFFKLEKPAVDKQRMTTHVNAYLQNVEKGFLVDSEKYVDNSTVCPGCRRGELVPIDFEGMVVCNNEQCSRQYRHLTENEKPSYKEPPQEVCYYAYKRINHFREILAQFQAKESTQIPQAILDNIMAQIKKERIEVATITNKKVKDILKKFGYNKYYEHIPFIKDKLGIKPPVMSPELEEKLCNLFMEIQRPYAKFCPADRVNFLNYYYTIYKLCELLEENKFLQYFPMLKDREKRIEQDEIWKKICDDLNWEFIPTV